MENTPAHWVHNLDPVIFHFTETIAIRWYGLAYVAGFLTAFGLLSLYWKRKRSRLEPRMQESLAMGMILGVVLGGRLGYFLLYEFTTFMSNPLVLFKVWEGGMASHGGFIGVAIATIWVARKNDLNPLYLGDLVASVAAPGLLFGRIANFINGELWGRISEVPWAVIFPKSAAAGMPMHLIAARHPSQLYEALLEGLMLFLYMQWRFWTIPDRSSRFPPQGSAQPGHLTGEFLIVYSVARWIGESFREPDAALILGLTRGSFYSLFLLGAGISIILWTRLRQLTNEQTR